MTDRTPRPVTDEPTSLTAGFTLGHGRGLVFAYEILPEGGARELSLQDAEAALAAERGLVWLHLDISSMLAKTWIEAQVFLPPIAREMLVTHEDRTQVHASERALSGILCDFHRELTDVDWRINMMHFFVTPHCLITGRRHALAAVERTQRDLSQGLKAASGIELLAAILDSLGDLMDGAGDEIGRAIEHAEDRIESEPKSGRMLLAETRKQAVLFHRLLTGERRVIARLAARPPAWLTPQDQAALQSAIEHLSSTADDLETLQVRTRLIQDEIAARLAENTNRNLYVLSVVSAVLLPMTLISGIYGMNLGGLPGVDTTWGFWVGLAEIAGVGFITLVILRVAKIL